MAEMKDGTIPQPPTTAHAHTPNFTTPIQYSGAK